MAAWIQTWTGDQECDHGFAICLDCGQPHEPGIEIDSTDNDDSDAEIITIGDSSSEDFDDDEN